MKRLQIMIEEETDVALEQLAYREHTSKAALIRRFVRERIDTRYDTDPLLVMAGKDSYEPANVDDAVYG